jgi:hypothetical protein
MNYEAFTAVCLLTLFAFFFAGPWQAICTDFARQVLFEKRDAIFDMAASGELDFRSQSYRTIRSSLNRSIRFAHQLGLWNFLVLHIALAGMNRRVVSSEMQVAVADVPNPEVRAKIARLVYEAQGAVLVMMILKSPTMLALCLLLGLCSLATGGIRAAWRMAVTTLGEIALVEAEASEKFSDRPVHVSTTH